MKTTKQTPSPKRKEAVKSPKSESKAPKVIAEVPAPAAAEIPDPANGEVLSAADEATKDAWWASFTENQHHALLKQANATYNVDPGSADRVTLAWRLFQAGTIALT